MKNKKLCDCGKKAVWVYMPSPRESNPYYCDDCVPRGCTCEYNYISYGLYPPSDTKNWKWIEENVCWGLLDDQGRDYPCVEYMKEGYDLENDLENDSG